MREPELTIRQGGDEATIPFAQQFVLGSGPGADVSIVDPGLAPVHLLIRQVPDGALLQVLAVPGEAPVLVNEAATLGGPLRDGDVVRVAGVEIVYRGPAVRPGPGPPTPRPLSGLALRADEAHEALGRAALALHRMARLVATTSSEAALLDDALDVVLGGLDAEHACVLAGEPGGPRPTRQVAVRFRGRATGTEVAYPVALLVEARALGRAVAEVGSLRLVAARLPRDVGAATVLCAARVGAGFSLQELGLASSLAQHLGSALDRVGLLQHLRARDLDLARMGRRLLAVVDTIDEGIVLVTWGHVEALNPRGRELLPRAGGTQDGERIAPGSAVADLIRRAASRQDVLREDVRGKQHIIEVTATAVSSLQGVVLLLRDVTAERLHEEWQRELERRLRREVLEAASREQRRIGHDLHDGLCQDLIGIGFMIRRLGVTQAVPAELADPIVEAVTRASAKAREIARGLAPVALGSIGLAAALDDLARTTQKVYGISCELVTAGQVHVEDEAVAMHLFSIVREAVNNAMKHGRATRVTIELGEGSVRVTDDGVGFDPGAEGSGMGLGIMRYRAQAIGSDLSLTSHEGGGTVLVCRFEADVSKRDDGPPGAARAPAGRGVLPPGGGPDGPGGGRA